LSSFIINKRAYVRVAGVVAGIIKAANDNSRFPRVYFYDRMTGENMAPSGYLEKFVQCYEMNVESVNEQYKHHAPCKVDQNEYEDDFRAYYKHGYDVCMRRFMFPNKFYGILYELTQFADSVNYQIENPALNQIVCEWFDFILVRLFRLMDMHHDGHESWGDFSLPELEKNLDGAKPFS